MENLENNNRRGSNHLSLPEQAPRQAWGFLVTSPMAGTDPIELVCVGGGGGGHSLRLDGEGAWAASIFLT